MTVRNLWYGDNANISDFCWRNIEYSDWNIIEPVLSHLHVTTKIDYMSINQPAKSRVI